MSVSLWVSLVVFGAVGVFIIVCMIMAMAQALRDVRNNNIVRLSELYALAINTQTAAQLRRTVPEEVLQVTLQQHLLGLTLSNNDQELCPKVAVVA